MTATKPNYGTYHRQAARRKTDGTRARVAEAFSNAWKTGQTFAIMLGDDGAIRVKVGVKHIAYYSDATEFAADFMPEVLDGQ